MPQNNTVNRRIVLKARPHGAPSAEDFRIEHEPVPKPEGGQVLLRTLHLSLDPYMRGRMSDGPSYVPREGIVLGLENAPEAFIGMLESKNSASWSSCSRTNQPPSPTPRRLP